MKKYFVFGLFGVLCVNAHAASVVAKNVVSVPDTQRAAVVAPVVAPAVQTNQSSIRFQDGMPNGTNASMGTNKDRDICMANNVGVGNTFVWASKNSNVDNYSLMVEDTKNPGNNICWVRVEMKSKDARINVSDLQARYFEMGDKITCGEWVDEEKLQARILDAKKKARTWATIGGAVGGAGVGVGTMELFGNKVIGGAVQGQKALSDDDLLESQLAVLKKDDVVKYNQIMDQFEILKAECEKGNDGKPAECTRYNYQRFLNAM